MKRRLLYVVIGAAGALLFVYVQSNAQQIYHDSCRDWREPPPWSSFCPPSTRNGKLHT